MSTTVRSFVVFRDDDPNSPTVPEDTEDVQVHIAVAPPPPGPLLVYCPDKENINPVTGLRASAEQTINKKRKTGILATKLHVPPPTKKHKDSKESKKRASSSTTTASAKNRPVVDKKAKQRHSSKRGGATGPSRARRSPSLPRVAEEVEEKDANRGLSQSEVDARCYELTVMPLADLSKAYEQVPALEPEVIVTPPKVKEDSADQNSAKEQLAVTTAKESRSSPVASSLEDIPSSPAPSQASVAAFSTPDRKRIYSAFTFSSPSPSSERYATLRGSSVERFSDVDFEPKI